MSDVTLEERRPMMRVKMRCVFQSKRLEDGAVVFSARLVSEPVPGEPPEADRARIHVHSCRADPGLKFGKSYDIRINEWATPSQADNHDRNG